MSRGVYTDLLLETLSKHNKVAGEHNLKTLPSNSPKP